MPVSRVVGLVVLLAGGAVGFAQTKIVAPPNKYSVKEDVSLGRMAAAETEKQMPVLHDDAVTAYVQEIGGRLADAVPPEFRHPEFHYTFTVLNVKDINAFALPGGPMYVHRGIIEAAKSEGELMGVMAHEMSHVALRHGTAQATKQARFGWGAIAGAVAGAVVGGGVGQAIEEGTSFGLGATFLRFSRDYEKQADLLGTQMLARAGYDPRDLARMFETIEHEGGGSPPQWLSDHPNPGNRVQYINEEASHLVIEHPIGATPRFADTQAHLKTLSTAPTLAELAKRQKSRRP